MSAAPSPLVSGPYAGRTLVLVNPAAGQEDPVRLRRRLGGAFAARGARFDMVETGYPGHATELAREAATLGYRACCVVGGDGTLAEVATGLARTSCLLGLVPQGTGNQVAQNLGIPRSLERAVETVVHGRPTPLDLGLVGERAFALVVGAGYDAAVMAAATRPLKERFGFAAYIIASLREAVNVTPAEFQIVADGRELTVRAASVLLANMAELFAPYLRFRIPLAPHRGPTWRDGLLDVVVLAPGSLAGFAAVLWRAARRQFDGDDRLIHLQAEEVRIVSDPPVAVQIDGDADGFTPVFARTLHDGVRILVP